jgi:hypothetical protein
MSSTSFLDVRDPCSSYTEYTTASGHVTHAEDDRRDGMPVLDPPA